MKRKLFLLFVMLASAVGIRAQEAYAVLSEDETTLTFYYDNDKNSREGTKYNLNDDGFSPGWHKNNTITTVIFNPSFAEARPTTTRSWFAGMKYLTTIQGVQYLNTQNVTDMADMFRGCSSLTSLNLSNFDTQNVRAMGCMFYGCSSLTSLDVSNFDTQNVTGMINMFYGCSSLSSLDLSSFDTQSIKYKKSMSNMFKDCSLLMSLKISSSLGKSLNNYDSYSSACSGVGSKENPCKINQPEGFDFGVYTSGDYFYWLGGYFKFEKVSVEKINVTTDLGYMTYCSDKTLDFTNVEGMKAYIVVGYDGKVAKLSRIGIAPAETGLLLKADAGEYEVPYTEEDNYVMNMLIGVLEETTLAPTEGNMTNLVLANGNNGLGFYCLKGSGTLAAHRAYLQVPTRLIVNGAKYIKMEFDDETTAIDGVTTQEETSTYYDMQGIRHEGKPSKQGIYIMNGKKIVVTDNGY
ncbi:MAG: BspA family leucine-rich repeat surface protein [Prevotella sp.]|nr:BspA family leucine-rich repeat surface protein [Prevotella sp.]